MLEGNHSGFLVGNTASSALKPPTNGVMISHINFGKVGECLASAMPRSLKKRGRFVYSDPDSGLQKKLFRLKFDYDHLEEVKDEYNIYQAAYVDAA